MKSEYIPKLTSRVSDREPTALDKEPEGSMWHVRIGEGLEGYIQCSTDTDNPDWRKFVKSETSSYSLPLYDKDSDSDEAECCDYCEKKRSIKDIITILSGRASLLITPPGSTLRHC